MKSSRVMSRSRSRSRSDSNPRRKSRKHSSPRRERKKHSRHRSRSPDSASEDSSRERQSSRERRRSREGRKRSKEGSRSRDSSRSKHKKHKNKRREERKSSEPALKVPKTKDEIRKEKELLKALETPEEKRARRLSKKIQKGKNKKALMGWDDDYMGYTNADNPFGDEHLLDTFMWSKKLEKEGLGELSKEEIEKLQKKKMMANRMELEKVKKRRLEREKEKEERDQEQETLQRDKEAIYFRAWEKQEDTFHLQQAKLRSKIRIEDGRAKPIDLMAHYISLEDDDLAIEMQEPYKHLIGLTIQDLEDLLEDIKVYVELEQGKNVSFWRDITIITEDELDKLRRLDPECKEKYVVERRNGVNSSVADDIVGVFKGKTLAQLSLLDQSIQQKLQGGEGVDIGYWETLLHQLRVHMARQRLKERHQEELRRKLFKLKMEQGIESGPLFPIAGTSQAGRSTDAAEAAGGSGSDGFRVPEPVAGPSGAREGEASGEENEEEAEEETEETTAEDLAMEEYDRGGYSPRLVQPGDLPPDTLIYDPDEDLRKIEMTRRRVALTGQAERDEEEDLIRTAKQGMNAEECQFSVLAPLNQAMPVWSDKYRPRKPRFFNRVHTGFEWNKYNQTHYDIDNPPPKIVQGYKFNIFYPDLIDKAKTPQHYVTPCEDNKDFATLRFHAGPPYEDIAFKIVNKEWEHSYKRGFRCQFYNNIFQLWFHFKRYRYRR